MNKNKKGNLGMMGTILIVFITLIVGVVLFQVIAQEVGRSTNTEALLFHPLNSVVANSTPQTFTNWRVLSDVTVYNGTGHAIIDSSLYTVTNDVLSNGALTVTFTPGAALFENQTNLWRINATGQPLTYIQDSGSRAVAGLIAIFFALAILVVILEPTIRNEFTDSFGK